MKPHRHARNPAQAHHARRLTACVPVCLALALLPGCAGTVWTAAREGQRLPMDRAMVWVSLIRNAAKQFDDPALRTTANAAANNLWRLHELGRIRLVSWAAMSEYCGGIMPGTVHPGCCWLAARPEWAVVWLLCPADRPGTGDAEFARTLLWEGCNALASEIDETVAYAVCEAYDRAAGTGCDTEAVP